MKMNANIPGMCEMTDHKELVWGPFLVKRSRGPFSLLLALVRKSHLGLTLLWCGCCSTTFLISFSALSLLSRFFLTIKVQEWSCKRENEETIILPIVTIIRTPPKPRAPQKVANPTQATVPAFPGNSIQHSPTSLNLVLGPAPTVPTNVVTKKISTYS